MAIKKFAKPMKIATVFVALALIIPSLAGLYNFLINRETKTVMLKVDGQKIFKEDFETKYLSLASRVEEIEKSIKQSKEINKDKIVKDEIVKAYILSQFIQEKLETSLSNKLGIKVSKSEITKRYSEFETQFGGNRNLVATLSQQGLSVAEFREQIKVQLINEKRLETIKSKINISDEEIEDMYNLQKYSTYEFKTFEESKEEIRNAIALSKARTYQSSMLEETLLNAKFEYYDEEIKEIVNLLMKNIYENGEYSLKLINVISEYLSKSLELALEDDAEFENVFNDGIKKDMEKQIRVKDMALSKGLKENQDLLPNFRLQYILVDYINYLSKTYVPTTEEMKEVYDANSSEFDTKHTISGYIVGIDVVPNEKDFVEFEEEAKSIMKDITSENFEEKAKLLSKDPGSALNGGNLGLSDVNNFVKEFKEALINGKVKDIVGPIRTQFGYHIIEILSKDEKNPNLVDARHILLVPKPKNAKLDAILEVNKLKSELESNKISFDDINANKASKYDIFNIKDSFTKVTKDNSISVLGYNREFNEKLFGAKVGEILINEDEHSYMLVIKNDEIPFKKSTFEDAKDKIKLILTNMYIANHLREI